ncbi:hypothetical protein LY90DRAFT_510608 [Neocallimastix californiae]|uniref:Uncharacterized protein n=1 Tax=Neocallimastix californiae TaxID=1754190 RepID=A0A1Y2BY44_9FUNG|nr:hypothetical protein LY90DRAFT_510608 [Neocallimastix californiae]|eukprot:ORY39678.1 hypothetical protein LY90DRAFT_510608 [Neocallimastix californiae]
MCELSNLENEQSLIYKKLEKARKEDKKLFNNIEKMHNNIEKVEETMNNKMNITLQCLKEVQKTRKEDRENFERDWKDKKDRARKHEKIFINEEENWFVCLWYWIWLKLLY